MEDKFESDDLTIEKLLGDFYTVPDYQREYVWGTDEVEKLLSDTLQEFESSSRDFYPEYFIGTIVTRATETEGSYELIDGQQRLTTLIVVLVAIRDVLLEHNGEVEGIANQLRSKRYDMAGNATFHHRVTLQYADSQNVLERLVATRDEAPISKITTSTLSARNLVQAYMDIRTFLASEFSNDPQKVRSFWAYITKCVKVIRIRTSTLSRALWIFETINKRGKGLDSMDLLKNLLFIHASESDYDILKIRWKSLADTLFEVGESPMRFMRHFLLAKYATEKLKADDVYSWLTNPRNTERPEYDSRPLEFVSEMLAAANAYRHFLNGRLVDGSDSPPLRNVRHMSYAARQHLILMLAIHDLPVAAQAVLAEEIERLYFAYLITGQRSNRFENDFVAWATALRRLSDPTEIAEFVDNTMRPERVALGEQFDFAIKQVTETSMPRYRLKYVLAKLSNYLDHVAYGAPESGPLDQYLARSVEIEHILSLHPSSTAVQEFGGPQEAEKYSRRLANLTLLEKSLNVVASNGDFEEKAAVYEKSRFLLTAGLVRDGDVGDKTAVNRALALVSSCTSWGPVQVEQRANDLVTLARLAWGMDPHPALAQGESDRVAY